MKYTKKIATKPTISAAQLLRSVRGGGSLSATPLSWDAASKDPAKVSIKLDPERIR